MSASSPSPSPSKHKLPPRRQPTPSSPLRASISADGTSNSALTRPKSHTGDVRIEGEGEGQGELEGALKQPHTPGLIPPTPLSPTGPAAGDGIGIPSPTTSSSSLPVSASVGSVRSQSQSQIQSPSKQLSTTTSSLLQNSKPHLHTISNPISMSQQSPSHALLSARSSPLPTDLQAAEGGRERPVNFQPFFTLIADLDLSLAESEASTHHPTKVCYLFSDDEEAGEWVGGACLRSLGLKQSQSWSEEIEGSRTSAGERGGKAGKDGKDGGKRDREMEKQKGEREERVIIVDINTTGDKVVKARSLTPNWQVLNSEICGAPIWDGLDEKDNSSGGEERQKGGGRGLMLRLEGVGRDGFGLGSVNGVAFNDQRGSTGAGIAGSGVTAEEDMQALLEGFDRKMGVLRKIVGTGMVGDGDREGEGGRQREGEVKVG